MTARRMKQTDGSKVAPTRKERRAANRIQAKGRPARRHLPLAQLIGGALTILVVLGVVIYAILRSGSAMPRARHTVGPPLTNPSDLHPAAAMLKPGRPAPVFTLRGANGRSYNLAAQRGHPVLLEFFAVWCPHCQHEAPIIERLMSHYAPHGIRIWAILANPYGPNYDASYGQDTTLATKADLHWFSRSFGEHVPQLVDPTFHVVNEYGVSGYPGIYVINKRGVVAYAQSGDQEYGSLATALDKALKGS